MPLEREEEQRRNSRSDGIDLETAEKLGSDLFANLLTEIE